MKEGETISETLRVRTAVQPGGSVAIALVEGTR